VSEPKKYEPVMCPGCGSTDVQWVEDVPVTRTVLGIGPSGRVIVEDACDSPWWEGGKDERLECRRCWEEWHHEAGYSYGVGDEE